MSGSFDVFLMRRDKICFVLIIIMLFATYPFVFNRILPTPPIMAVMLLAYCYFIIAAVLRRIIVVRPIIPISVTLSIGAIISMIATGDVEYYKQLLYIWWGCITICFIYSIGLKKFLFLYNRMILLIAILGVVSFFMFIVFGDHSLVEFEEMDGRTGWLAYFTFTNTKNGIFIRYAGVFDEPGAMASWGMFSLLLNKVYVKDNKIELPLIICLLFTFSIAYLLQLVLYLFFFYFKNTPFSIKLIMIITVAAIIGAFMTFIDKDAQVYLWTFGRLGIGSSTDFLEDNNRIQMMEEARKIFLQHPVFGIGTTLFYGGVYAADNPYETLAKDGVVGTLFIYFPIVKAMFFAKRNKEILYMIVILLTGYLQRPFHINILHYTMLFLVYMVSYQLYKINKKPYEIQYNNCNI